MSSKRVKHRGVIVIHPAAGVSGEDLGALRESGYVPIIAMNDQVVLKAPVLELDGGEITAAALRTIATNESRWKDFGKILLASSLAHVGYGINPDGSLQKL